MTGNGTARAVAATINSVAPASFADNALLYGFNLFLMTAACAIGVLMVGKQCRALRAHRATDHLLHPISLYRFMILLAGIALALRGGCEALHLWSWNSGDIDTIVFAVQAKRWIDPVSICCTFIWFGIAMLSEPGIELQLRKMPLPIDMWSRWPALRKPVTMILLAFGMAVAAVALR